MIDYQHLHQQIQDKLYEIAYKIKGFNKAGDSDISRYAESYFKRLLNIIYKRDGWCFTKALKVNQDTYDLYDSQNRVCFQITSNDSPSKKKHTITQFELKYAGKEFDKLFIFFVSLKKPKLNQINNIDYKDFNIVEFFQLIEGKCDNDELLAIRDILLQDLSLHRKSGSSQKIVSEKSLEEIEIEFLRTRKLEKDLKFELLNDANWRLSNREEILKYPYKQFKSSRFIIRSIQDETYPNVEENSAWSRTFMYQFYEKGIEIELGALLSPTVRINEDGRWFLEEYSQRLEEIPEDWKRIKVVVIGKLPFRNIIDYKDHDEYYSEYHLFCKYTGVDNSPYEEISYRYENVMGYFWNELDLTKKID